VPARRAITGSTVEESSQVRYGMEIPFGAFKAIPRESAARYLLAILRKSPEEHAPKR
jgi:hypothetical protein